MAGKTLSLNSLLSAEKLENHFQVAPNCRNNKTQCAELQFWGGTRGKKRVSLRNRDRHFDETAEKKATWRSKTVGKAKLQNQGTKKPLPQRHCYYLFWSVMTCSGKNIAPKTGLLWLCSDCSDLTNMQVGEFRLKPGLPNKVRKPARFGDGMVGPLLNEIANRCVSKLQTPNGNTAKTSRRPPNFRGGPKGVSTKGVSMKRPNFPYFSAFYTVGSKGNF